MRLTLESKRNGITKYQIDRIAKELNRLQKVYPEIVIEELGELIDNVGLDVQCVKYGEFISIQVSRDVRKVSLDDVRREFFRAMIENE